MYAQGASPNNKGNRVDSSYASLPILPGIYSAGYIQC